MVRRIQRRPAPDDPRWTSEIEPAPGDLRIVQAFVNTAASGKKKEELAGPRVLASWLLRWRLIPEELELTAADFDRALALRAGMRALLRANNGAKLDEKAVAAFDRAAAEVPMRLRVDASEGAAYLTASSARVVFGSLLGLFVVARFSASWPRFKACIDSRCGSAFYDDSRGPRRKWCSARCANRFAARVYRSRRGIKARSANPSSGR